MSGPWFISYLFLWATLVRAPRAAWRTRRARRGRGRRAAAAGAAHAARAGAPARSRDRGAHEVAELALEIAQVRGGIHARAGRALEQLLRRERAAVRVHVLAEPLAQRHELTALELLVEIAEVCRRTVPELHGDDVPERVGRE